MRFRAVLGLLFIAVISQSCRSKPDSDDQPKSEAKAAAATALPGEVRLTPEKVEANGLRSQEVAEMMVAPVISAPGRVRPRADGQADVFPPFAGRLVSDTALPKPGDSVTKGQRLAEVEQQFGASEKLQMATTSIQLQGEIDQAQHELDLRRTELNRAQQLYDGGAIPQRQLQSAEFDLKQAETRLESARHAKEQVDAVQSTANAARRSSPIVAPISGTVVALEAAAGQQVDPSKKILSIADLNTVWVEATVQERDLPHARNARRAEIVPGSMPDRSFVGSLVTVGASVDPQNRTVPMIFTVANPNGLLKLDMFVEARVSAGTPAKALVIPASAVLSDAGATSVYVEVQPGVYRPRSVSLAQRIADKVVVASGLAQGEKVVTVGAQSLRGESHKTEIPVDDDDKPKKEK